MDVRLPGRIGDRGLPRDPRRAARDAGRDADVSYPDEEAVLSAIIAGASGYLLKQIRARDLVAALEAVGRGESLLDPAVTGRVLDRVRRIATGRPARRARPADVPGAEDPAPRRRGQDEQGDRGRGLPVRQDRQELRQLDPRASSTWSDGPRRPRYMARVRGSGRRERDGRWDLTVDALMRHRHARPRPVAGIRSGDQVYVHCAAAAPSVLLDALVARARRAWPTSGSIHLHIEGPGPHLAPEMARALPAPRPVHRAQRA